MKCCRSCNSPIPARAVPGRPGRYCSDGCRRRTELRIKRLRRRLERLEDNLDQLIMTPDNVTTADTLLSGRSMPKQRQTCAALIDEVEHALIAILSEESNEIAGH